MKELSYTFYPINNCNMCGAPGTNFKILGKRLNQSQGLRPKRKSGITTTIVKCTNCQLIFSNPQPVPQKIDDHYGTPPEEYWIPEYFEINPDYFKDQIDTFCSLTNRENGDGLKALDIGAGLGKCMISLESAGFDAYGIEPSTPFFERAINKMKIDTNKLSHNSMEDAEFPSSQFEFITFGAVLEHLYDPSNSLIKAMKWLKSGGLIHIEVPSSKWLTNKIANLMYRLQGYDYVANISPMHLPFHLYEFGLKSFQKHAEDNNYQILFHKFMVCDTYLPKLLNPIIRPIMKTTNTGMQLEIWLQKNKIL